MIEGLPPEQAITALKSLSTSPEWRILIQHFEVDIKDFEKKLINTEYKTIEDRDRDKDYLLALKKCLNAPENYLKQYEVVPVKKDEEESLDEE